MDGDGLDHEGDGGGERVVDVVGEAEAPPGVRDRRIRGPRPRKARTSGTTVIASMPISAGTDPMPVTGSRSAAATSGVLVGGGCRRERVVQAGVAMGERSLLLRDRSEGLDPVEPVDAGGEVDAE